MADYRSFVVVFASQGPLQAEVAKGKLESYGVTAVLRYSAVGRALGLTVDGLGLVEVLVSTQDVTVAEAILGDWGEAW